MVLCLFRVWNILYSNIVNANSVNVSYLKYFIAGAIYTVRKLKQSCVNGVFFVSFWTFISILYCWRYLYSKKTEAKLSR